MDDQRELAKQVICDLIAASGGRLHSKVRLYKAFYYAHLAYWQNDQGYLTSYPMVRMPMGPGIDRGDELLAELQAEGRINIHYEPCGPYKEAVFELATKFSVEPHDPRYQAAETAIEWIDGKTGTDLTNETHIYSRTWNAAKDGEELSIYLDTLDDQDYNQMKQRLDSAQELINAAFTAAPEVHSETPRGLSA